MMALAYDGQTAGDKETFLKCWKVRWYFVILQYVFGKKEDNSTRFLTTELEATGFYSMLCIFAYRKGVIKLMEILLNLNSNENAIDLIK